MWRAVITGRDGLEMLDPGPAGDVPLAPAICLGGRDARSGRGPSLQVIERPVKLQQSLG